MRKNPLLKGIYLNGNLYWYRCQRDGKRQAFPLHTADMAQAIRNAAKIRSGETQFKIESGNLMEHIAKEFVSFMVEHGHWTDNTMRAKTCVIDAFAKWCGRVTPDRVTLERVQAWYTYRRGLCTPNTAHGNLMVVSSFFNWCRDVKRIVAANPVVVRNKRHKFAGAEKALILDPLTKGTREEFCRRELRDRLINDCPREDLKFVLYCGFHAGLRREEIAEAVPWWFHLDLGVLELRKTPTIHFKDKEERSIPLTRSFRTFLEGYKLREPFMLRPEIQHGRWRYRYDFRRPFEEYMKDQGCPSVRIHTMRHTFASLLAIEGCSIYKIAIWLGDSVEVTRKHYAKLAPGDPDIELSHSSLRASQAASSS